MLTSFVLSDKRANPNEIQQYVDKINALSLPVTRSEIDQLAEKIRNLSDKLPQVDDILNKTGLGLSLAKQLQDDANKARLGLCLENWDIYSSNFFIEMML